MVTISLGDMRVIQMLKKGDSVLATGVQQIAQLGYADSAPFL
jgi:hypothetical protein